MGELSTAISRELRVISESLARLAGALDGPGAASPAPTKSARKGKRRVAPERQRAMELHGRYLNLTSRLTPRAKARVKTRRKNAGVEAAIALAQKLSQKKR